MKQGSQMDFSCHSSAQFNKKLLTKRQTKKLYITLNQPVFKKTVKEAEKCLFSFIVLYASTKNHKLLFALKLFFFFFLPSPQEVNFIRMLAPVVNGV